MLVVTPNTCLDVTTSVATLVPGTVTRASATRVSAGGKGVNVCRTLRALGGQATLVGLSPTSDDRLADLLATEGCAFVAVPHSGQMRLALILLEESGRVSVINGRGPEPDEWDRDQFIAAVQTRLTPSAHPALICSGSIPPLSEPTLYRDLIELAHAQGVPAYVDPAIPVLEAALPAEPDLISPNLSEAEGLLYQRQNELVDEDGDDVAERCIQASRELHARGARRAVVTGGSAGAALTTANGSWWLAAARVEVANPIGAGDSFLAGAAAALASGATDLDAVRHAIAVAGAAVQHPVGGMLDPLLVPQVLTLIGDGQPR